MEGEIAQNHRIVSLYGNDYKGGNEQQNAANISLPSTSTSRGEGGGGEEEKKKKRRKKEKKHSRNHELLFQLLHFEGKRSP